MESNVPPEINPPSPNPSPAPPPLYRPPPLIVSTRPPSRGTGWKIFAAILLVLLVLSVIMNFQHAVSNIFPGRVRNYHGGSYGPRLEEVTIKESSSTNKIVVIPVEGIISGDALQQGDGYSMVTVIKEQLKRAKSDSDVRAVILKVNSPGGEVLASDEIANAITDFQTKSGKPVIVSMGSLAASGGYYVSAPCQWIVANELTITGSIGVIMHGLNYRGLLDKIGVRPEVFKSGKYKDMMSGTKSPEEITPEERQMVQSLIDETFGKFKSVVTTGRQAAFQANSKKGQALNADWESYADGRILSGKEAFRLGFVDELGNFEVATSRAKQLAGISGAELIEYQPLFDFSNLFRLLGESNAKSVKLDIGTDMPKLHAGYLYFLTSTYLQ